MKKLKKIKNPDNNSNIFNKTNNTKNEDLTYDMDIANIMKNIIKEIKEEKDQIINMQDNSEDFEIIKVKKIYNIEVEENIELLKNEEPSININSKNISIEIKGIEFNLDEPISNTIKYNERLFF